MLNSLKSLNINFTYKTSPTEPNDSFKDSSFGLNSKLEDLLANLSNTTAINLENITDSFLKSSLWPLLQPHNWRGQAEKILQQPEYIVMLILCVFALLTNITSIVAVSHVRHSLTTHLKLIINLAVADILIIISVLTHIVSKIFNYTMSPLSFGITEPNTRLFNSCFFAFVNSFNIMSFLIVLLNLLAMAMDHYIAIIKPLRYPYIMTKRKGYILIAAMWFLAALGGFSNFIIGTFGFKSQKLFNICEYIMYDSYHAEYLIFGITIFCLFAITFIYTRIFFEVRRINAKMPAFPNFTLHNNKALITTLLIIGTFILCWLPNCLFQITMIIEIHLNKKTVYKLFNKFLLASKYLYILQLMNCLLDPIIYAVRLKIVKKGYRNFLKRLRENFSQMKSFIFLMDICKTQTQTPRQRTFTRVTIEMMWDLKMEHTPCINDDMQQIDSESQQCYKPSEGSDVNDNELVPFVSYHEHSAMGTDLEPNSTIHEYIPMVTIHRTTDCEMSNQNGILLLNQSDNSLEVQDKNQVHN